MGCRQEICWPQRQDSAEPTDLFTILPSSRSRMARRRVVLQDLCYDCTHTFTNTHTHTHTHIHTHTHTHTHTSILANGILLPLRPSPTPIITLPADIFRLLPRATCSLAQALSCSPFALKGPNCDTRLSRIRRTLGDGAPDVRCGHRLPRRGRAVGALRVARQATLSFAHYCFVCWQRSGPLEGPGPWWFNLSSREKKLLPPTSFAFSSPSFYCRK